MGLLDKLFSSEKLPVVKREQGEPIGGFAYRSIMVEDKIINQFFFGGNFSKRNGNDIEVILFISALVDVLIYNKYPHLQDTFMPNYYKGMMIDLNRRGLQHYAAKNNLDDKFIGRRLRSYSEEWQRTWNKDYYPSVIITPFYHAPLTDNNDFFVMSYDIVRRNIMPAVAATKHTVFKTLNSIL